MKVLDLFCGCGGMTKGLTDAGLDIVAGIDVWDKAIDSYKSNHKHMALCEDIRNFPPSKFRELYKGNIDVLVGGPP